MAASSNSHSKLTYPRPWKLRLACTALIAKWLAGAAAIVGLGIGFGLDDRRWLLIGLAAIGAFVVLAIVSLVLGSELPCNICRNPLLIGKGCRKHQSAKRFLGLSYQLGVAVPALLTARFNCMYCGERIPLGKRRSDPAEGECDAAPAPVPSATADESSLPAPR